jgi:hypothetical protein
MARPGPQTQAKRQRELVKREKRDAKALRKAERKAQTDVDDVGRPEELEGLEGPNAE